MAKTRMFDRATLLMAAMALLYFGPLLAGLGGAGWPAVYAFAVIFTLWLIVLRPQSWPRDAAQWRDPLVLLHALTQVVAQCLLVAVLFGVGRGIGGALGAVVGWPAWFPLSLSFLSVPLARLIWDPWMAEEMERRLAEAGAEANRPTASPTAPLDPVAAPVADAA